jgi:hypothetical protein
MVLGAFGDSFIYGSDLQDCQDTMASMSTYPALIANNLELHYECNAYPGIGNHQILNTLLDTLGAYDFYVISWTWIDRFDYVDVTTDTWQTIRPTLDNKKIDDFYYRNLHSELSDKQRTLGIIYQAVSLLEAHNCKYFMTYQDPLMLDQQWHCPPNVRLLQSKIKHNLSTIDNMTFLEWARKNQMKISDNWHPLELAHEKAAEYWLPAVKTLLNTHAKEDYLHAFK